MINFLEAHQTTIVIGIVLVTVLIPLISIVWGESEQIRRDRRDRRQS